MERTPRRPLSRSHLVVAAGAAWALVPRPACAHDHWLEAEPFRVAPGQPLALSLWVGEHLRDAEPKRVTERGRYLRAELIQGTGAGGTARRDLRGDLRENEPRLATLTTTQPGTHVVALDAATIDIELPAAKFEAYLREEGLDDVVRARARTRTSSTAGRERYSRYLKTLVQVGAPVVDETPTRVVGQELEIVPEQNPMALGAGARLTVRVLFRGRPLAGAAVIAASRAGGEVVAHRSRCDRHGRVGLRLDRAGVWIVRLVHMERAAADPVDWRSYWASLTFDVVQP